MFGVSFSQGGGSQFPYFLVSAPVSGVGSVACVGFLVEGTGACGLVGGTGSCLPCGQGCVQWCVRGVCEVSMILAGSLLTGGVVFLSR